MAKVRRLHTDILVVGGGAAGMAAAAGAASVGASVLLADERPVLGGVLPQCIHHGFGLGFYGEDLTGPEYCAREADRFMKSGASYLPSASVTAIGQDRTALITSPDGMIECSFDLLVLATGSRERTLYSLSVAGTRPSGVYTAGEAQELLNLGHYDNAIGSRVVILGSGDIGQIMARRLSITGRKIIAMAEIRDSLGGMKRNHEECIDAYHIPVIFNATVTEIHGYPALTSVTLHHLDTGTNEVIECDTLITALGLIPEISLADPLRDNDGNLPGWLHLCGNAEYVHEIVDRVTTEALRLGEALGDGAGS